MKPPAGSEGYVARAKLASAKDAAFELAPGLALASALAAVAWAIGHLTPLPSVPVGLALGMLLSGYGADRTLEPGLGFGIRTILRMGVALLGAQITLAQLIGLGLSPVLIAVGGLVACLFAGFFLARALRLSGELAYLTAAAVAICGASAALAVSAVLPKSGTADRNAGATVAAITVIGTVAMVVYPAMAGLIGLDALAAGVFLGASLHEVVQAVGAGFAFSDSAGEVAAAVKLIRVACLAPVVIAIGWWSHRSRREPDSPVRPPVPGFLLGFLALAALASVGAIPAALMPVLRETSKLCLLVAIVALGMRIAPRRLLSFGPRPILAILGQTLLLAVVTFGAVAFVYAG